MNLLSINLKRSVKILVIVIGALMFCSTNSSAQNFIGKDLLACNFDDDDTYFKFINDTFYIKFDLTEEYEPFSVYSISGDTITWNDINPDDGCDPELTGLYIFMESGDSTTFEVVLDDCEDRLSVLVQVVLKVSTISNVQDSDIPEFKLYPNPVINSFSIETNNQENYNFQLINSQGQIVLENEVLGSKVYNIEWIAKGNYFIRIFNEDKVVVKTSKLIKM